MVARGHTLHDLLCVYPISTLNDLTSAARENHRDEHVASTNGVLSAVMQSLDSAFNKGKGKVMKKYMDRMYPVKRSKNMDDATGQLMKLFKPRK
jgi:hypothetical protein